MLGAHDLEDFYELQDEDRSTRRHAPAAEEASQCPLCRLDAARPKLRLMPMPRWHRCG